jgi:hypothetical protein
MFFGVPPELIGQVGSERIPPEPTRQPGVDFDWAGVLGVFPFPGYDATVVGLKKPAVSLPSGRVVRRKLLISQLQQDSDQVLLGLCSDEQIQVGHRTEGRVVVEECAKEGAFERHDRNGGSLAFPQDGPKLRLHPADSRCIAGVLLGKECAERAGESVRTQ